MVTKGKKNKQRGSMTHGWGSKKKHRGAGSRGGVGRAGITKHMRLHFKKKGIQVGARGHKSMRQKGLRKRVRSVNLRDLHKLAEGNKEIILREFGYDKVIGTGELRAPLRVIAKGFSAKAMEKIESAKGQAVKDE
ncbi:MAG: uL15 family ribosomal protein [Candidatus Aenigmarchaeota archaeon]|nr:uL15 family ribosomal protein [Candidatus Aenigmarchaeota archaeon]